MSVIDLEAAVKFWEMKPYIIEYLKRFKSNLILSDSEQFQVFHLLNDDINKIESLGKKENK